MTDHTELGPDETRLDAAAEQGLSGSSADEIDRRIFWLVRHSLRPVGMANGGWDQLYLDPRDGRYWELTFPQGSLFGGGRRRLECVPAASAAHKYELGSDT